MSKDFRFELNGTGVVELLKSDEMQTILGDLAASKAREAGDGYDASVHVFKKRAVAHIYPTDFASAKDNYDNNTLVKVVSG